MYVIGAGRIGTALHRASTAIGHACVLVDRRQGWEALAASDAPIIVTVRNDDLDAVVQRIPPGRREALVFIQNGMLRGWLSAHDLAEVTRGLLFFAVPSRGAPIEPGGTSPFHGPRAAEVVSWMQALGISAHAVDAREFALLELEKLLWNSVFGLLCDFHDTAVGEVVDRHRHDVEALSAELSAVAEPAMGISLSPEDRIAMADRMCRYSQSIATYRGSVKEWPWRNGWFWDSAPEPETMTPLHTRLLRAQGHVA